jgi:transposase
VPQNFIACDREQELLLPPSLHEWLPDDHLAWFVLDAVEQIDLGEIYCAYREDGWGRAAFDPQMMVALMLYAYALGERSSRMIERRCREDIAFRVITANQIPDHATLARFRARHEEALAGLFNEVLRLCAQAGLVSVGLLALDGTKVQANAAMAATRTYETICEEMLSEAARVDAAENERLGADVRGDELPPELADRASRRARLERCKAELEGAHAEREQAHREVLRDRERWEARAGRKLTGRKPQPPSERELTSSKLNVTDPDSRPMKDKLTPIQGYNAQVLANSEQIIIAAAVTQQANDSEQLPPMVARAEEELGAAGVKDAIGTVIADGGYWSQHAVEVVKARGTTVLVPPFSEHNVRRKTATPHSHVAKQMHAELQKPTARVAYRRRQQIVEPIFANTKTLRRADRFMRRGLSACEAEWQLIATTHNLLKLWRRRRPDG